MHKLTLYLSKGYTREVFKGATDNGQQT